jgi:hypothetical protein
MLENIDRRLDVRDVSFVGPRAIARNVDARLRGYGQVLMPDNLPIRARRLIEEEGADREAALPEDSARELSEHQIGGECADARVIEQVACATAASVRMTGDTITQLGDRPRINEGRSDCPSVRCNGFLKGGQFHPRG